MHVLADGRIQKTGGKELALELEKSGYADTRIRRRDMNIAVMKTKAEQAISESFEAVAGKLPGSEAVEAMRAQAIGRLAGLACRIGASRNGSTLIFASTSKRFCHRPSTTRRR